MLIKPPANQAAAQRRPRSFVQIRFDDLAPAEVTNRDPANPAADADRSIQSAGREPLKARSILVPPRVVLKQLAPVLNA